MRINSLIVRSRSSSRSSGDMVRLRRTDSKANFADEEIFVVISRLGEPLPERIDDLRAAPKADAIFESAAVPIDHKDSYTSRRRLD